MTHLRYLAVILVLIIVNLITCNSCRDRKKCPEITGTTVKSDTVYRYKSDTSIVHVPKLVTEVRVDSFVSYEPIDRMGCNDYNIKRIYTDTVRFREGKVIVNNAVYQNRIEYQQIILDSMRSTVITNTVTNTVLEKKRNSVWFGANGGWRADTSLQVGASIMFQNKKRTAFEVGAKVDSRGIVTYEAGIKIKL